MDFSQAYPALVRQPDTFIVFGHGLEAPAIEDLALDGQRAVGRVHLAEFALCLVTPDRQDPDLVVNVLSDWVP